MFHDRRLALLASAMPLHAQLETKDANIGIPELKTAVDEVGQALTDFRKKNDEVIDQIKKKGEDAVSKAELEKINKAVDDAIADFKKRSDEIEAKANRLQLSGAGDPDAQREAKAAKTFGEIIGKADYSVEQLREYKADLAHFLRRNDVKAVTLMVGQDPSGGYWVTPDTTGRMVKKVYESTPMRQLANVVAIGTDKLEGPIDNGEADAAWVGEVTTRSQTDAPTIGMWEIPVNELYAYPKVTQRLLEDAKIDVEAWLGDKASSKFSRKENTAFVLGTGVNQPRGITTYTTVTTADDTRAWGSFQHVVTGTNGGFGATTNGSDKLLDLIFEVKAAYRQAAKFLMARRTMGGVRKLKDGQGNYVYGLGLREGALVENIYQFPVVDGEDMPAFTTTDALGIAFGDFAEAYTIVDRLGISVIRDNITQPGFVKFLMRKRVGGGAVNFEAVKFLKFSA
jgi:HK97 family phage major capsid protein